MSLLIAGISCDNEGSEFKWNCNKNSDVIHVRYDDAEELEVKVNHVIDGNTYKSFGFEVFQAGKIDIETRARVRKVNVDDTLVTVYMFYPATEYIIRVYNTHDDDPSYDCWEKKFTTVCAPFNSLYVADITTSSALVTWSIGIAEYSDINISQFELFTLNFRKKGETETTLFSTDEYSQALSSLSPDTEYEVQVVYTCTDNIVYPSAWMTFKTF